MYRLMDTFSSQHQSHESEIFAIFMPFLSQDFTRPGDHDFYFISYTYHQILWYTLVLAFSPGLSHF